MRRECVQRTRDMGATPSQSMWAVGGTVVGRWGGSRRPSRTPHSSVVMAPSRGSRRSTFVRRSLPSLHFFLFRGFSYPQEISVLSRSFTRPPNVEKKRGFLQVLDVSNRIRIFFQHWADV